MAADIRIKYPATDSVAITLTLTSLATSSTFLAGRESTLITNSNNDLDHIISGKFRVGTTPTANTEGRLYAYTEMNVISGTPTYPDVFDGTDSAETLSHVGVFDSLVLVQAVAIPAATSSLDYYIKKTSIKSLFGYMPKNYGLFFAHNSVAALDSTAGNHVFHYERIQAQTV